MILASFALIAHISSVILELLSFQTDSDTFVDPYNAMLSVHQNSLLTRTSRELCNWIPYLLKFNSLLNYIWTVIRLN